MNSRSRCLGVTIIEAVVALTVVGAIITLTAPSMRGMISRHRVEGLQAELLTDLRLARSEASQRSGTLTSIAVTFGGNADVSCYTIHVEGANCDCTRAPGTVCMPAVQEIKSIQYSRAGGVAVAASSPSGSRIKFEPPQGWADPSDLVIDIHGSPSGQLRTSVSKLGVPIVCSPDGSIRGVATC
jgi:Tfp pilus assembly protein FimT